jgi:hypothetical protein
MDHIHAQLTARRTSLARAASTSSIEVSVSNSNNTSIELPAEILALIDNKAYLNRHKKLYRLYPRELMELARIAMTKPKPSHWYATATRKTNAEGQEDHFVAVTLQWIRETVLSVQQTAERVVAKIGADVTNIKAVYKQIWQGVNVERWADMAQEMPHDKAGQSRIKHFAWLCRREIDARAVALV